MYSIMGRIIEAAILVNSFVPFGKRVIGGGKANPFVGSSAFLFPKGSCLKAHEEHPVLDPFAFNPMPAASNPLSTRSSEALI